MCWNGIPKAFFKIIMLRSLADLQLYQDEFSKEMHLFSTNPLTFRDL